MTRDEIATRARKVVVEQLSNFGRDVPELTDATSFIDDLKMDSLDRVDLTMGLEDEFDVAISDEDADQLPTLGQVVDWLAKELAVSA